MNGKLSECDQAIYDEDGFYQITFESKHENNGTEANCFVDRIIIDPVRIRSKSYVIWLANSVSDIMVCCRVKDISEINAMYKLFTSCNLTFCNSCPDDEGCELWCGS